MNPSLRLLHDDEGLPGASAVGGGSIAVQLVHLRLAELAG